MVICSLFCVLAVLPIKTHGAEGPAAWSGYAWKRLSLYQCLAVSEGALCHAYHQKWDWKRDQWVDVSYGMNAARGTLDIALAFTNRDRTDRDDVCVTVLFLDAGGRDVFAFHQNLSIGPLSVREEAYSYSIRPLVWQQAARIAIGTKQCRSGPHEDDVVYTQVTLSLGQR